MPFRIALSGLNAASADLKVTGNNVANAGTVGFKQSRAEFADVYAVAFQGLGDTAIGGGVRLAKVAQQFTQGNIDFTQNALDLAINGEGFFVLSDAGTRLYTRAGAFSVDREGYVVNAMGQRLQVFPANSGGGFNTGALSDLRLDTSEGPPNATTKVTAALNLKASESALGGSASDIDITDPGTYNYSTSLTVYDSLGQAHTATMYFRKVANNEWASALAIDGTRVGDGTPNLQFDSTGAISSGGSVSYGTFTPGNGAATMSISFDYSKTTQYGTSYAVNGLSQDGYTTGRLSGIDIDSSGVVFARYTNGQSKQLGKVALARFPNPQGLEQRGDTVWAETYTSGDVLLGEAGTGTFGAIQSGALEASNVDIAEQLVNLITAQRNFQANAQVITTADTVTQTIINIR